MKKIQRILVLNGFIGLLGLLFMFAVQAQVSLQLILVGVKQIRAQEDQDEIYFLISDLDAKEKQFYTVPGKSPYFVNRHVPTHMSSSPLVPRMYWNDKELPSIKNVSLWQRDLAVNKGTELLVSLVEADVPPWDIDDSLGTFKFELKNRNNKLLKKFITEDTVKLIKQRQLPKGTEYTLEIKGERAKYQVVVRLMAHKTSAQRK